MVVLGTNGLLSAPFCSSGQPGTMVLGVLLGLIREQEGDKDLALDASPAPCGFRGLEVSDTGESVSGHGLLVKAESWS